MNSPLRSTVILLLSFCSVYSQECECDAVGSLGADCDSATGQCACRPGVGGLRCNSCLDGYTAFSPQGCRLCECNAIGSVSETCSEEGVCQCRPRVSGDQCDVCAFSYRNFMRGCTPCPPCFDEVSGLFSMTEDLYSELLMRLNFTLEAVEGGGVNPTLLALAEEYRRMLEELLARVTNATSVEAVLTSRHSSFALTTQSLSETVSELMDNLTTAESSFRSLDTRSMNARFAYDTLLVDLAILEEIIQDVLRQLLEDVLEQRRNLGIQLDRLRFVTAESDLLSLQLQSEATQLLEQILLTLQNANTALQRLQTTITLQNQTQTAIDAIKAILYPLETLEEEAREALDNATRDVPAALNEAERALEAISSVTFNLTSRRQEVEGLEGEVVSVDSAINNSMSRLNTIRENFSTLNDTGSRLLNKSRTLNMEAESLLNRSREAFLLGNTSASEGNRIIAEARDLLAQIQALLSNSENFSADIMEVLRLIREAESVSAEAEGQAETTQVEIDTVAMMVDSTTSLLEEAIQRLDQAMVLAGELNINSTEILSDSISLNTSTTELAEEVVMATREVEELDGAVAADQAAIAATSRTANASIMLSADIMTRIIRINAEIANLTNELNLTELLSPERLREVTAELEELEDVARQTGDQVDMLTEEIARLQESAAKLRERYTMLLQHRALLQEILSKVERLDCTNQFEDGSK